MEIIARDWRQDSAFSEKVDDLEVTLPRHNLRIFGMFVGMLSFWTCVLLSADWILDSVSYDLLRPSLSFFPSTFLLPKHETSLATSKEAYVLSLPSVEREEYLLALRVLLYGYKYDHDTRDPSRDVIVMTTPHVPVEVEDQLRADGAIIFRHDLIPSITDPFDINSDHICRHCYNKLLVWNMTQYERVLLADSDFLMVRSLEGIWDEPESQAETGLAARSVLHSDPGTDYLDSSFVIARPNRTMFEELLLVQGSPGPMQDIGQSLLDKYFRKDGPHPWSALDEKWMKTKPDAEDLAKGIAMLHEKCWMDSGDWALTSLWSMKVGKMLGHQLASREGQEETEGVKT